MSDLVTEEEVISNLGDSIGYGRVMQLCEKLWGDKLEENGLPRGGACSTGACVSQLVPCKHEVKDDNGHCEICCGSGRVTKWVSEFVDDMLLDDNINVCSNCLIVFEDKSKYTVTCSCGRKFTTEQKMTMEASDKLDVVIAKLEEVLSDEQV